MIYTLRDSSNHKMTIEQINEKWIDITIFEDYDDDKPIYIDFTITKTQLELLIDALNSLNKKMK
jgi:hypothetical protein